MSAGRVVNSLSRHPLLRYAVAILAVALAQLLQQALTYKEVRTLAPSTLLYGAILLSAWLGGFRAGVISTLVGALSSYYFHIRPTGRWVFTTNRNSILLGLDVSLGILLSGIMDKFRRIREEAIRRLQILKENEEEYRAVFELAPDGRTQLDPSTGRFLRVNRRFCELTGYSPEELSAMTFSELTYPADQGQDCPQYHDLVQGPQREYFTEKRCRRKNGELVWVQVRCVLVSDNHGRPHYTIASVVDVTSQKNTELQLQEQAEKLAEADRRKDEFLAMLAHELRNPLAPIRSATEILRLIQCSDPIILRQVRVIDRQAGNMGRLIEDLLDISRITRGKVKLRKEWMDLVKIVRNSVETCRQGLEQKHHALALNLPEEPIWLNVDPTRMEQVFVNILNNAVKYMDQGGKIEIAVGTSPGGDSQSLARVQIRDQGVGIAPELLPHIFDLFVQAEQTMDRAQGGLGIGLSMVHHLVKMHGGSVQALSEGTGKGSQFIVRLPLPTPAEALEAEAAIENNMHSDLIPDGLAEQDPTALKILVVDDNVDAAATLETLLSLWGHEIMTAHDGLGALEAAATFHPDIILLDIGLPGLNGYEVAQRLRSDGALSKTVLIALTGYGQEEDINKAREAGFDYHLTKPVDMNRLHQLIQTDQPMRK